MSELGKLESLTYNEAFDVFYSLKERMVTEAYEVTNNPHRSTTEDIRKEVETLYRIIQKLFPNWINQTHYAQELGIVLNVIERKEKE